MIHLASETDRVFEMTLLASMSEKGEHGSQFMLPNCPVYVSCYNFYMRTAKSTVFEMTLKNYEPIWY